VQIGEEALIAPLGGKAYEAVQHRQNVPGVHRSGERPLYLATQLLRLLPTPIHLLASV
jgi:hypothetical protein